MSEIVHGEVLVAWREHLQALGLMEESFQIPPWIFVHQSDPDHIVRSDISVDKRKEADYADVTEGFTQEIWLLDDQFGIKTPGFSMSRETTEDGWRPYLWARRVEGSSFKNELHKIPRDVAVKAYTSMADYFEGIFERGQYFWDLALRQLVYGVVTRDINDREVNDGPEIYMVDPDPQFERLSENPEDRAQEMRQMTRRIGGIMMEDLAKLQQHYGERFEDLVEATQRVQAAHSVANWHARLALTEA